MSTRDLLLMDLYHASRETQTLALVSRNAPVLYFDAQEPFLPLAAGYTVFTEDGPSPSMQRQIELRPENLPAAARCIEYAIWWDWDIHHLYELEHAWVYLDAQDQPVRVEASWHGKFYEIPVRLENGRPVLLSEPGKHAFAPDPSWFRNRNARFRRVDTQNIGAAASVLINDMFTGKIRDRVFDRTLARSYLHKAAFQPSWEFSKAFTFHADHLVPWEALYEWIPRRVNAWLERLEGTLQPNEYQALRMVSGEGTPDGLQFAARSGADAVILPLSVHDNRLVAASENGDGLDVDEVFRFCRGEPMGAFFETQDADTVDRLAWFVRSKNLQDYTALMSMDVDLLTRYKSFIPQGKTIVQLPTPEHDAVEAAQRSGAQFVNPRWENLAGARENLTPEWVQLLHQMGLGVVGWPVEQPEDLAAMQRLGVDMVWQVLE